MRLPWSTATFSVGSVFVLTIVLMCTTGAGQTNTLIIIADDLGVDTIGAYKEGASPAPTPNIDSLAARGVMFRNAYAAPTCSPTRATYLTGRYGFRTGVGRPGHALPVSEITLPEVLDHGKIAHALIGKWHLAAGNDPNSPNLSGWSHFSGSIPGFFYNGQTYFSWRKVVNGRESLVTNYATSENVDDALKWIKSQTGPWVVSLNFNAAHTPLHEPPGALHTYHLAGKRPDREPIPFFKAMIQAMDTEIGRLLTSLGSTTLARTNVIFLGDNGTEARTTEPPFQADHAKWTVYEGGINVPLIVSGPAVASLGREEKALVCTVDLFHTIAEFQGLNARTIVPAAVALDGISLVPYLRAANSPSLREFAYAESFNARIHDRAVRNDRYKLIDRNGSEALYDLLIDPFEQTDLLKKPLSPDEHYALNVLRAEFDRLAGRASYFTFGSGCGGVTLGAVSGARPVLGQSFRTKISNLGSGAVAVFGLVGFSRTHWGTYSLPLDLGFLGMPTCRLYTSIDAMVPLSINHRSATWEVPIPALPELLGWRFYQQGLVIDASANQAGAIVTNAGQGCMERE